MRKSSDRILTSHAGSLPRPDELIAVNAQREAGKVDESVFQKKLTASVADVVKRQVAAGITVPGDGEYGKSMGSKVNYRAWWSYSFTRLSGLRIEDIDRDKMPIHRSRPGEVVLSTFADRRERASALPPLCRSGPASPRAEDDELAVRHRAGQVYRPCRHCGRHRQLQGRTRTTARARLHDFIGPRAALASAAIATRRMTSSYSPVLMRCATSTTIVDAGLVLQIDDPAIAENFTR
jgi:5-methyltetrahydropteroyltriglutamate--homocysteine methyltransferase